MCWYWSILFWKALFVKMTPVKLKSFECMHAYIKRRGVTIRKYMNHKLDPSSVKMVSTVIADLVSKQTLPHAQLIYLGDSSVTSCCPTPEISSLASSSISHHFQILYRCIWTFVFRVRFISIFHTYSSTQPQSVTFIWFSLVVCSQN